jgi:pimeloyl-ACP methyl ester carboxylesterase
VCPPGTFEEGAVESYIGASGEPLRYRVVSCASPKHRLLYLHGIESHGTWFLPAAQLLREYGCTTYLVDRRGSGLNREHDPGDARSARVLLDDIRRFRQHLGDPELELVGLSWGGKLALAAALDQPQKIRRLILVTPGLRSQLRLSFRAKCALVAGLALGGRNRVQLPITPEMFTTLSPFKEFIRDDPWRITNLTARLLRASASLDHLIKRHRDRLAVPVLAFLAEHDRIVDNRAVEELAEALPPGQVELEWFEGAGHSVQFERLLPLVDRTVAFLEGRTKR